MRDWIIEELSGYYHRHAPLAFEGHRHREREFKYLLAGTLEVTYGNTVIPLQAGDVMLTEPGVFHRERTITDDCEYLVLQFSCEGFLESSGATVGHPEGQDAALCHLLSDRLSEELCGAEACAREQLDGVNPATLRLFEAILVAVTAKPRKAPPENAKSALYRHAVNLMRADLSRHLSIRELARELRVSPTRLKSVFSEYTGVGIQSYYLDLRMEAAMALLSEGYPVADVAVRLGFSSPSYFSQCFRRECGCAPGHYRKAGTR